jgi:CubicO group peptidase (beta-lactamase class C family)
VIRHGRVADIEYKGTRCHDGPLLDEETVWEAASLTKPVVARYALRLAAAGGIDLDEPLRIDLAAVQATADPRWAQVTIRRVLTHTSGLPNWRGPRESQRVAGADIPRGTEVLTFKHDPGLFGYSGEGFEVLLHALCGRFSLGPKELLESILQLFRMPHSSFLWQASFADNTAFPHLAGGQVLPKMHPLQPRAAGSLHTTLPDYVAFSLAALGDESDEIFRPGVDLGHGHGRSLGWGTVRTPDGIVAWQHGDNRGFKHLVALRRDQGDGVVIFTNSDDGESLYLEAFQSTLGTALW